MDCYGNNSPALDFDLEKKYWERVLDGKELHVAANFITHQHDPITIIPFDTEQIITDFQRRISKMILDDLFSASFDEIIEAIDNSSPNLEIKTIPLFNDVFNGTCGICQFLSDGKKASYVETGTYFTSEYNRIQARQKYGEEHLKLGASLGLVALFRPPGSPINVGMITSLGLQCSILTQREFDIICPKLFLRIPIIAELIKNANNSTIKIQNVMKSLNMKESTINRRTQSVKAIIRVLNDVDSTPLCERLSKIYW